MQVAVEREWLLQYPDGRVAMFVVDAADPDARPTWVPVLRVWRRREAWMNLRLRRRDTAGGEDAAALRASRLRDAGLLMAEYELVRTDGRVLAPSDVVREPFRLHDEVCALKREAAARNLHVSSELAALVDRLPTHYRSVGVRVYNPKKAAWKLQLVWAVQLALCAFLVLFFCNVGNLLAAHRGAGDRQLQRLAYFIDTLLIQAFACEFREILSVVVFNFFDARAAAALLLPPLLGRLPRRGRGRLPHEARPRARAAAGARDDAAAVDAHLVRVMGKSTFVEEDLLGDEGEAAIGEALREAAADHAVVASQLRGAQRTWRLAHPLGEAQLARLHLDQGDACTGATAAPTARGAASRAIEVERAPRRFELHAVLDAHHAPILPGAHHPRRRMPPPPPMAPPPPPPPPEEESAAPAFARRRRRAGGARRGERALERPQRRRRWPRRGRRRCTRRRRRAARGAAAGVGGVPRPSAGLEAGADDEATPPDVAPPPVAVPTRSRSRESAGGYPPAVGHGGGRRIDMASLELASPIGALSMRARRRAPFERERGRRRRRWICGRRLDGRSRAS